MHAYTYACDACSPYDFITTCIQNYTLAHTLTNDVQVDEVAHMRCRGNLTLVHADVAVLRIFDLKHPVLRVLMVYGPKALVRCVRVASDRQQMNVAMSDPGHLQNLLL